MSKKSSKRPWRQLLKKQQRKRKRQRFAKERDKILEEEELTKLNDPLYRAYLEHQEQLEQQQKEANDREHNENEEQWLRRELLAQKAYKREEQKRLANEQLEEQLRQQQHKRLKEQEDALKRKLEMIQKQNEQAAKEFEESMLLMEKYLEDTAENSTPPHLQKCFDSRPGEKPCEFYTRTNCCRFGMACVYNHQRTMLSKVILIKHFFQHSFLDSCSSHKEYSSADEHLEVSEQDCQEDYAAFCQDVWPEMESFGNIVNFRTIRNKLAHTKGHVFVEYANKRSALKAFIKLQDRYYASKRLKCEFSHITNWRAAICGLNLANKCPKGDSCNYLHLMQNPRNKYNMPLGTLEKHQSRSLATPLQTPLSWNDVIGCEDPHKNQRWRWSESPEIELESSTKGNTSSNDKNGNLQISTGEETETARKSALQQQKCRNRNNNKTSYLLETPRSRNADNESSSTKHNNEEKNLLQIERKQKHKSHRKKSSKEKHKTKHKKRERMSLEEADYKEKTQKSDSRNSRSTSHHSCNRIKHCDESCSAETSYGKQNNHKRTASQEEQNKNDNLQSFAQEKQNYYNEQRGRSRIGMKTRERSVSADNTKHKHKSHRQSPSQDSHKKHKTSRHKSSKDGRKQDERHSNNSKIYKHSRDSSHKRNSSSKRKSHRTSPSEESPKICGTNQSPSKR